MVNVKKLKSVHLIGIGGINMSAVAKLLLKSGITVTGSDLKASEVTDELVKMGVKVAIGEHDERNLPAGCQAVIRTSATRDDNPERLAAKARNLPDMTNFEWMGAWFKDRKVVLVTGTHGKSTTTALLGEMCIAGGLDPTVVVGSMVPNWPDKNLRFGDSELVIIEGDEYAKHFLEFSPSGLIINNIELDHTDIYKDIDDVRKTFEKLLHQVKKGGVVVINGESEQAVKAVKPLAATNVLRVVKFGHRPAAPTRDRAYEVLLDVAWGEGLNRLKLDTPTGLLELSSPLIGDYNAMNVCAAAVMARELGVKDADLAKAAQGFAGIWRRMELVGQAKGAPVYSDYGHHPTAVSETIAALRQAFPDKRIVLCFQPHHKNRTKQLFGDFAACFDRADVLVLCEIYDVPGRSAAEDADMTSQKLLDAIKKREMARPLSDMEYAPDPASAVKRTLEILKPGDVCVFMGAGDMDAEVRKGIVPGA